MLLLLLSVFSVYLLVFTPAKSVYAVFETTTMAKDGAWADDPAIWVNSDAPSLSLIIGTKGPEGMGVYNLSGTELQQVFDGNFNNVDLRDGFLLNGHTVPIVAATDVKNGLIVLYTIDTKLLRLRIVPGAAFRSTIDPLGICMYRNPDSGAFFVFVTGETEKNGVGVDQWEIYEEPSGMVNQRLVRHLSLSSSTEGCVADDELGFLYVAEQSVGIWKYDAAPGASSVPTLVDSTGISGNLTQDVEGLTKLQQRGPS